MVNWRNMLVNPPMENCNICLKIGSNYETYQFERYSGNGWALKRGIVTVPPEKIPDHALYINLDEILG